MTRISHLFGLALNSYKELGNLFSKCYFQEKKKKKPEYAIYLFFPQVLTFRLIVFCYTVEKENKTQSLLYANLVSLGKLKHTCVRNSYKRKDHSSMDY